MLSGMAMLPLWESPCPNESTWNPGGLTRAFILAGRRRRRMRAQHGTKEWQTADYCAFARFHWIHDVLSDSLTTVPTCTADVQLFPFLVRRLCNDFSLRVHVWCNEFVQVAWLRSKSRSSLDTSRISQSCELAALADAIKRRSGVANSTSRATRKNRVDEEIWISSLSANCAAST